MDNGIHPLPAFIKNGQNGSGDLVNAIKTLINNDPVERTRFTFSGLQEVVTYPAPYIGVILRGQTQRPEGPIGQIILDEVTAVRGILTQVFPDRKIPIIFDMSHDHAKMEGGGAKGQLRVADAVAYLLYKYGLDIDGVMMESYKHSGKQPRNGLIPGKSITDECIGEQEARKASEMLSDAWLSRNRRFS